MSTHCSIGLINEDGTIEVIYCHFDGYPEHTGYILLNYYDSVSKIKALLKMGNLSILGRTIEESVFYFRDHQESRLENESLKLQSQEDLDLLGESHVYLFDARNVRWVYASSSEMRYGKFLYHPLVLPKC